MIGLCRSFRMSERSDNEVNKMANKGDQAAIEHAQDGLPALFTKMADELTQLFDLKEQIFGDWVPNTLDRFPTFVGLTRNP